MIIEPKFRGFICTTAHPDGCRQNVSEQIEYIRSKGKIEGAGGRKCKNVLIIGSSTGFGLSSRITAAYGCGAATFGVYYERPASESNTASAGWYNNAAFETFAAQDGLYAKSINGDAFSDNIKQEAIETIKQDMGQIDLLIYSIASPRRTHPKTGELYSSVIKPIGRDFVSKTVDFHTGEVYKAELAPATDDEVFQTIKVMGGEDWKMWAEALADAGVAAPGMLTVAYSYIGPETTHPMYKDGTIGAAKNHLRDTAKQITSEFAGSGIKAYVSVNKALVTQSSMAIPVVPLYVAILNKVMQEMGLYEGTIEQTQRLLSERLYRRDGAEIPLDENGFIRIDDLELREDVQKAVEEIWNKVDSDNVEQLANISAFRDEFFKLFGFGLKNVDYTKDIDLTSGGAV